MVEPRDTIKIVNVVASTDIAQEIDLKQVTIGLEGADYDPKRFPAHKLGISKEEYALLNVAKKYLSNRSDSDLTAFVKELDRKIKTMLFPGWWRKVKMATEVEQTLFDTCFQKFAGDLDMKHLASLSEELMNFIVRYNP